MLSDALVTLDTGDPFRARLLTTRALAVMALRGRTAALAMLAEARAIAVKAGDAHAYALTHIQESAVHLNLSDWAAASAALSDLDEYAAALNPRERSSALLNRGLANLATGRFEQARDDLTRAVGIATGHGLAAQEFKARHNLGCVAHAMGDVPLALRLMAEADALPVAVSRTRSRLDQVKAMLAAGLVDSAQAMVRSTIASAERDGEVIERGELLVDLARCALLQGDTTAAARHIEAAIGDFEERGAEATLRWARLTQAQLRETPENAGQVLAMVDGWLAEWPKGHQLYREAQQVRAQAAIDAGMLDEAVRTLELLAGDPPRQAAHALGDFYLQAQVAVAQHDERRVDDVVGAASDVLARHQAEAHSLEVRAGLAVHGRRLAVLDARRSVASGDAPAVLRSVQRWRALSLRSVASEAPRDDAIQRAIAELRRLHATPGSRVGMAEAIARQQKLVDSLLWRAPARNTGVAQAMGVNDLAAEICSAGAVLVSFIGVDGALWRVVTDGTAHELRRLGDSDAVEAVAVGFIRDMRGAALAGGFPTLQAMIRGAAAESGAELDSALLDGVSVKPGSLVLVEAAGTLSSVPWGALPSLVGERFASTPSAARWAAVRRAGGGATGATVFAGPGPEHALDECRVVASIWGVTAPSALARSGDVRAALGSSRLVHLAAHGRHEDESPLFSNLYLADGPLFAHELPRAQPDMHVVLSACDVGRSRVRGGDEHLGLAAALLALGARSVLAAAVPVDDAETAHAMADYHRRLAAGEDAASALATVRADHPVARSFVLHGDTWSVELPGGLRPVRQP